MRWRLKPLEKGLLGLHGRPRQHELRERGRTLAVVATRLSGEWYFYTLGFNENVNSSGDYGDDGLFSSAQSAMNEAMAWVRRHRNEMPE